MQTTKRPSTTVPKHVTRFAAAMDDSLVAMARYWDNLPGLPPTKQSQMNYVAVLRSDTPMSLIRSAFGDARALPALIADDLLAFAAKVMPVTSMQVARGEWWGERPSVKVEPATFEAEAADLAMHLMSASVLLASRNLADTARTQATEHLAHLVALFGVDDTLPLPLQLAACFATLEVMLDDAGFDAPDPQRFVGDETVACLPGVRAIYDEIDSAIMVLESGESLIDVDWQVVEENFAGNFGRIQFTTTRLLPLIAQHRLAVAFAIERYRLHWGVPIINDLDVTREQLVLNAAETVLELYARDLPHGYINAHDDEMLGKHIHDLQNDFLKVNFQYELLTMMCDIPRKSAPRLHIDRSLPRALRITGLRHHLREWLHLYEQLLAEVKSAELEPVLA